MLSSRTSLVLAVSFVFYQLFGLIRLQYAWPCRAASRVSHGPERNKKKHRGTTQRIVDSPIPSHMTLMQKIQDRIKRHDVDTKMLVFLFSPASIRLLHAVLQYVLRCSCIDTESHQLPSLRNFRIFPYFNVLGSNKAWSRENGRSSTNIKSPLNDDNFKLSNNNPDTLEHEG